MIKSSSEEDHHDVQFARHMRLLRGSRDGFRYRAPVAGHTDASYEHREANCLSAFDISAMSWKGRDRYGNGWHADLRRDFSHRSVGMLHNGVKVEAGVTIGDVDRREEREYCDTISGGRGDSPLGPKPGNPAT